eukprot:s3514_g2.t1
MTALMKAQPHCGWDQVRKQVLLTKPACHEATPYMFTFLKNFSHEGLMKAIDTRIKSGCTMNKVLGKEFFVQLSAQSKDWKQPFLHLRHAVLSLAYTAEKQLHALDVKKLMGKELAQRSTKAQDLMIKFRALLDKEQLGDSSSAIENLFHQFQDHLILECLDKMKDETPESSACSLVDEIEKILGKRITAEFDGQNTAQQLPYDSDGQLVNPTQLIQTMGFVIGSSVIRGSTRATITDMKGSQVQLSVDEGDTSTSYEVSINSFLKGEWKVGKKQADVQKFTWDEFQHVRPHLNDIVNFMCVKGEVSRRLMELEIQHESSCKGLVLQTKPYKSVFTAKHYAKGKLILVPSTQKIEKKACPGSVALGTIRDIGLHLWPCYGPPKKDGLDGSFMCPFWMVKRSNKESEANVEIRKVIAEDQENNSVKIPLMYNTAPLDPSTELKLFVPKAQKEEPEALVPVGPQPKRQRGQTGSLISLWQIMAVAASSAAASDPEADAGPFTIEQRFCISYKKGAECWYPEVVSRMQENYIKLSKFDRHFVKFALGKPMDLSKGVSRSANSTLFDKLLQLRKEASEESARQQMEMPESADAQPGDHPQPKRKSKRVRSEDGCLVDPRVTIQLPELETKNEYFLSRPAKVLWGVTSKELWLELNEHNMQYMRAMVKHGEGQQQPRKKKENKVSPKSLPRKDSGV